ncbi:MAG: hypothetical protein J5I93_18330, partial [Pirellulaceae bacterium]|nr:hypothetical protein [Pirellulaceae bacterium]
MPHAHPRRAFVFLASPFRSQKAPTGIRLAALALVATLFPLLATSPLPASPALGPGSATLAVSLDQGATWRQVPLDWTPPDSCLLRSSPLGARQLLLGTAHLTLDADTQIHLEAAARRVNLLGGRIHLRAAGDETWQVLVAGRPFLLTAPGEAQWQAAPGSVQAHVAQGSVQVRPETGAPIDIPAATRWQAAAG